MFVLAQICRLVGRKNNVFVVGKNKDCFGIHLSNSFQHILCARIHGLAAFDHSVCAKLGKDMAQAFADGNHNKAHFLCRLCSSLSCICRLLLCCDLCRILNKALLVLLAHIVNLDFAKRTVRKCLLNCQTRVVGVDVSFDDFVVCNNHDGIANALQESLVFHDLVVI